MGCLILSIFTALSYSNSLHGSWIFDDIPNILENTPVHLKSLDFQSIKKTFHAAPGHPDKFYRPVAVFSFGLNWYFGGNNVFGFHLVNLFIHIVSSLGVFFLISALYDTPRLRILRDDKTIYIAWIGATLWALNPVQTQAISYIVQRMASLAALFYICGMLTYIYARKKPFKSNWPLYLMTLLFFLLSTFSKENGILLPCSLILTEIIFISNHNISGKKIFFALIFGALISYPLLYLINGGSLNFLSGYNMRGFTLTERALTEPSVLIYYISLLLYPNPDRLSLDHDFPVSTSLIEPLSTLAAIVALLVMVISAITFYRKTPIVSFAFLFFLLNHLIESTVWPLELVFEHRNYLPSIFFFWPIASGLVNGITYLQHKKRTVALTLLTLTVTYTLTLGIWTFSRNTVWKNEKNLWSDSMTKHPDLARPYQMMAVLLESGGYDEQALHLYQLSLEKKDLSSPKMKLFAAHNNMGLIYLKTGRYEMAINSFNAALSSQPGNGMAYHNLITTYLSSANYKEAERLTDLALAMEENKLDVEYLNYKAFALQKLGHAQEAVIFYKKIYQLSPENDVYLLNLSLALAQNGDYNQALHFLNQITISLQSTILFQLVQLENELRGGSTEAAEVLLKRIFLTHTNEEIKNILNGKRKSQPALDLSVIIPILEKKNL